jgi:hypothetical protein
VTIREVCAGRRAGTPRLETPAHRRRRRSHPLRHGQGEQPAFARKRADAWAAAAMEGRAWARSHQFRLFGTDVRGARRPAARAVVWHCAGVMGTGTGATRSAGSQTMHQQVAFATQPGFARTGTGRHRAPPDGTSRTSEPTCSARHRARRATIADRNELKRVSQRDRGRGGKCNCPKVCGRVGAGALPPRARLCSRRVAVRGRRYVR